MVQMIEFSSGGGGLQVIGRHLIPPAEDPPHGEGENLLSVFDQTTSGVSTTFQLFDSVDHGEHFDTLMVDVNEVGPVTSTITITLTHTIPEPSTGLLLSMGLVAMSASRRRSRARVA
jgi:hypothetical protein